MSDPDPEADRAEAPVADGPPDSRNLYRILDASINRASEGLRTVEEFARFLLDHNEWSRTLKSLRHDLADAVSAIDRRRLLTARDTDSDVGTEITVPQESSRPALAAVVAAAASRVQQSLRVVEEYSKLIDPLIATNVESIRYRCYTVTARVELAALGSDRRRRLCAAKLYCLIDGQASDTDLADKIHSLAAAGVDIFQLRDPSIDDRTLLSRATAAAAAAHQAEVLLIVNDRPDVAIAARADGVHVGQDELPCPVVRELVGAEMLVGISTHSTQQATAAAAQGADYLGCGPVFPSRTKEFDSHVGTDLIRRVADLESSGAIDVPVFAIGGIDLGKLADVIAAGGRRIAVAAGILNARDPQAAAEQLSRILNDGNSQSIGDEASPR